MQTNGQLLNFINGQWTKSSTSSFMDITNPATADSGGDIFREKFNMLEGEGYSIQS